jgi:ssRNA-specific RNase YbeY (16S rRNA maturation enzyme)
MWKYLEHDTLTDVISFDYSVGNELMVIVLYQSVELKITPKILMSHLRA